MKMFCRAEALVLCAVWSLFGMAQAAQAQSVERVIIDTDPGTDDALAILLALRSPELRVEALTIVAGNVTAPMGLENALKIVSLAGRCDLPVAEGAQRPLHARLNIEPFWNGPGGLGGAELPPAQCRADPRFGPDVIIELVHKHPHEITIIGVGPETNLALAILKDPTIVPLVKRVVLMAGSISGGNVNGAAEFNVYCDPDAADLVFRAGWAVTMVGLDVTEITLISSAQVAEIERSGGAMAKFVAAVARFQVGLYQGTGFSGGAIHDALAVGATIDPSLFKLRAMHIDVETEGRIARGETVANRLGTVDRVVDKGDHLETVGVDEVKPNAQVAVGIDSVRFLKLFMTRLSGSSAANAGGQP
ncbi:MAG TPA: nucleoside hydrolase [Candidatus Acidoferrales bacterium]